jgi:hypothetical protein
MPAAPAAADDFSALLTSPAAETTEATVETSNVETPAIDSAASDLPTLETAPEAVVEQSAAVASSPAPAAVDPLASTPVRTWHDNTGTFEVTGRLVVVLPDAVRLLKDNGRFTTVPMRRLSDVDRQYVDQTLAQLESQGLNGKFITVK